VSNAVAQSHQSGALAKEKITLPAAHTAVSWSSE
jgi:hypothetical protein